MSDLPTGRFACIYADPPWEFTTRSAKGKGRSAEAHYDCMTYSSLVLLHPQAIAAENCTLLMWTTDPMLPQALGLIAAWGFEYKTVGFYWMKTTKDGTRYPIGQGYWTRGNPEQCLLAVRGRPIRLSRGVPKLIVAPRREHSRKPDEAYERIEALCPGPYLELFARAPEPRRPGWTYTGHELDTGIGARRWRSNSSPEDLKDYRLNNDTRYVQNMRRPPRS